jgi:hypothetical protein
MRRKILQEFPNSFCQRVIDLPSGYDLASFAHYGSGSYEVNILTGSCSHNGIQIPSLRLCEIYRKWMNDQLDRHDIKVDEIHVATLRMLIEVNDVSLRSSFGQRFASADFFFECESEIATDEKSYAGRMSGHKEWGFDWYYIELYGALPDVWPPKRV